MAKLITHHRQILSLLNPRMVLANKTEAAPVASEAAPQKLAAEAEKQAINDLISSPSKSIDLLEDAKTKIDKTNATDQEKTDAKKLLDQAAEQFKQAKEYIQLRAKIKANQNLLASKSPDQLEPSLNEMVSDFNKLQLTKYPDPDKASFINQVRLNINDLQSQTIKYKIDQKQNLSSFSNALFSLSNLLELRLNPPGVDEASKKAALEKINTTIGTVSTWLEANLLKEGTTPEDKKQYDGLKKALANFDASQSGAAGWQAGAKEFLSMKSSEIQANRYLNSLSFDENKAKDSWNPLKNPPSGWENQEAKSVATEALAAYQLAVSKSANSADGDSTIAAKNFAIARDGFAKLLAMQNQYAEKKERSSEKDAADQSKKDYQAALDGIANPKLKAYLTAKLQPVIDNADGLYNIPNYNVAKSSYLNALSALKEQKKIYSDVYSKSSQAFSNAVKQFEQEKSTSPEQLKKIVYDYLNASGAKANTIDMGIMSTISSVNNLVAAGDTDWLSNVYFNVSYQYNDRGTPTVTVTRSDNKGIDLPKPEPREPRIGGRIA